MTEKYAWMMESTSPVEFARIASLLPPLDAASLCAVEDIIALHVSWKAQMERQYPCLSGCGRPLRTAEDSPWSTSFETYLRGELKTCSPSTLEKWRELVRRQDAAGINAAELVLRQQVTELGYAGLKEAECRLKAASFSG